MWCLLMYLFLLWFPLKGKGANNRFREWSHGLIDTAGSDPAVSLTPRDTTGSALAVSMTPLNPLPTTTTKSFTKMSNSDPAVSLPPRGIWSRDPRCHWHRGIRTFQTIISIFSANKSHMRNGFSPWIRALEGIVWWKKPRAENPVALSV
jgi:hypothetical protein